MNIRHDLGNRGTVSLTVIVGLRNHGSEASQHRRTKNVGQADVPEFACAQERGKALARTVIDACY